MNDFEQYLLVYNIDPYHLFRVAQVRYQAVYNAQKGHPITLENAKKIRDALLKMTGVPYEGLFVLIQEESPQFPPSHIKRVPSRHRHL